MVIEQDNWLPVLNVQLIRVETTDRNKLSNYSLECEGFKSENYRLGAPLMLHQNGELAIKVIKYMRDGNSELFLDGLIVEGEWKLKAEDKYKATLYAKVS